MGDGFNCEDKCTLTLAKEQPSALAVVKNRGKSNGRGFGRRLLAKPMVGMAEFGLKAMTRCSYAQKRKKRQEAFKSIIAGMKETGDTAPAWKTPLDDAPMSSKFRSKASVLGVNDLDVGVAKRKLKKNGNGAEVCEEADIDLRNAGAYDVVIEDAGDEALACLGKRPISKLVKKTETTYDKYCWNGHPKFGSWSAAAEVPEGAEYMCGRFEFFVESMAVVSDGATDAPTASPTLAPTPDWYLMQHDGIGKAVQCAGPNQVQCASDDGVVCNQYNGTEWEAVGTNDAPVVSNDNPIVMDCPGWVGEDGEDPCHELQCYLSAGQLSGGDTGVYTTEYNLALSTGTGAVYKCNHGHRKCAVSSAGARLKFVEVAPADMPDDLIFTPAEDFQATADDGSFFTEGNYFVYLRADGRLEHRLPFAHPAQQ